MELVFFFLSIFVSFRRTAHFSLVFMIICNKYFVLIKKKKDKNKKITLLECIS